MYLVGFSIVVLSAGVQTVDKLPEDVWCLKGQATTHEYMSNTNYSPCNPYIESTTSLIHTPT